MPIQIYHREIVAGTRPVGIRHLDISADLDHYGCNTVNSRQSLQHHLEDVLLKWFLTPQPVTNRI